MKTVPRPLVRSAFTLIELLTVIAIIGVLAAITIPVVGKVRESGRRTQSLSNLRQIAVAMNLHAGDHRGFYPLMGMGTGFDGPYWPAHILPYIEPKKHVGAIFTAAGFVEQSGTLLDPFVADGKHNRISDYGNNGRAIRPGNRGALSVN